MSVTYPTAVKNARLNAVAVAIGATGVLEIGSAGMAAVLATLPLANPAAPAASGGVLTFTMPQSDLSADTSGTAAAARVRTATGGTDIISGLTVGLAGSGADVILDSVSLTAGQTVIMDSFTVTHA